MKVIHMNDESFVLRKVYSRKAGTQAYPEEYWGCAITNKSKRNTERFATFVSPNGLRSNYFDYDTFKNLCCGAGNEHIYINIVDASDVLNLTEKLEKVKTIDDKNNALFNLACTILSKIDINQSKLITLDRTLEHNINRR